jgi:hypothetical protein
MVSEFAGWMQMMKLSQTVLEFDKTLWVHYGGGVEIKDKGTTLALTGKEEEAYLKVLNHFGRVMKLYTFDDGRWVDAETGLPATPFDESLAGRLPHPVNLPAEKKGEMGKKVKMGGNVKKVKTAQAGKSAKSGKAGSQDKPKAQAAKSRKSSKTTKLTAKPKTAAKAADGARKSKAAGASKSSRGTTGGAKQGKDAKGK